MKYISIIGILFLCGLYANAELKLPSIISDNMVLQRDEPARVWGRAEPGAEVTVAFAGQSKSGKADKSGNWEIRLDPMPASAKARTMVISSSIKNQQSKIQNILVGEVWQAAGQSNMQWSLMGETHWKEAEQYPANDMLRLFKQLRNPQGKPVFDPAPGSAWVADSNASRRHFSAVAYYFAYGLQKTLGVPVGISLTCEGGTRCQYWTPIEAFEKNSEHKEWLDDATHNRNFHGGRVLLSPGNQEGEFRQKAWCINNHR